MTVLGRKSLLSLVLLLGACAAPRVHVDEWTDIGITQPVDVWTQGRHWRLYGVTVLLDSITGIPTDAPLSCDSCRVGFPRSQIDSTGTREPSWLVEAVFAQTRALLMVFAMSAIPF